MKFLIYLFSLIYLALSFDEHRQQIEIVVNEELPLSTILFMTNENLTYRLFDSVRNQNSFVTFQPSTGHLILDRSIDREQLCFDRICSCSRCQLLIELIEWQAPYRLLKLMLIIEDINDNPPKFPLEFYRLSVMENVELGFELGLEQAQDVDLAENARLSYVLESFDADPLTHRPFELFLKPNGALILKVNEKLDRETRDFYEYRLIAYDHGQPKRFATTKLTIEIEDVNDNPVELEQTSIRLSLSENTPIGTVLTKINATDKDIGLNGKIHYSISNGFPVSTWMDYFRLSESTGILTLMNRLDFESEQSYSLNIQIRDHGENSLTRFMTIDIDVIDENDNDPQAFVTFLHPFLNQSTILIEENSREGQMLAHISISDQDSGINGEVSCQIEQGERFIGVKQLEQRSFLLIVQNSIDREQMSTEGNRFVLKLFDHGQPSRSTRLEYLVEILDVNDNRPIFNHSFDCHRRLTVSSNQSIDRPWAKVKATDLDAEENGRVSYSIVPPNDFLFSINDQGEIYSKELLNQSTEYRFEVMAIDHGRSIRLNSTKICSISTFPNARSSPFETKFFYANRFWKIDFQWVILISSILFILLIVVLTMISRFCCKHYGFYSTKEQTYHLYVTVPRQSTLFINDDHQSNEHERLMESQRDQTVLNQEHRSTENQFSFPSSLSPTPTKPFTNNVCRTSVSSVQDSRPVSLSISTTTTCASCEIDGSLSPNSTRLPTLKSTVVRLAEEENSEI